MLMLLLQIKFLFAPEQPLTESLMLSAYPAMFWPVSIHVDDLDVVSFLILSQVQQL